MYVLEVEEEDLKEYDIMLVKASVNQIEQIQCPSCNAVMVLPNNNNSNLFECVNPNCKKDICTQCHVLWHINETCEEFQVRISKKTGENDKKFKEYYEKEGYKPCPSCGIVIERTEGCYHMTHIGCIHGENKRTDYCYFCGEILMKKPGEGWRYSKSSGEKHFIDGVYSPCVNQTGVHESFDDLL